jgi:hypothetical protein
VKTQTTDTGLIRRLNNVPNDEIIAPIEASYLVAAKSGTIVEEREKAGLQKNYIK